MQKLRSHTIFFILALVGILILFIYTYLAQRPLSLDGNARETVQKAYHFNKNLTIGNFIVYVILLFVSNIMYIRQRYWDTFIWAGLIFSTFTLLDWWWLSEMVFHYKKTNDLWEGESNLYPFFGIIIALFGLFIAVLNYLSLKRIYKEKDVKSGEQDLKDSLDKKDL
ncbi:MAG: hypothetical protein ACKVQB_09215 [Bacteroidia bacterium]